MGARPKSIRCAKQARPRDSGALADAFIEVSAFLALERAQVGQPVRREVFHPWRIGQHLLRVFRTPLGKRPTLPRWLRGDKNRERHERQQAQTQAPIHTLMIRPTR